MTNQNNNLLFYKGYYKGIEWDKGEKNDENEARFKAQNEKLISSTLPKIEKDIPFAYNISDKHTFVLETTYPGLLLGSGISHGSGRLGEVKIGFFFDHTTGLPVIAGSSLKGILRSVWPLGYKHAAKKKDDEEQKQVLLQKAKWVTQYLQEKLAKDITPNQKWSSAAIEELEVFLFGSYESGKSSLPMSGRTIFHDSIPISAARVKVGGIYTDQYLGTDYITPHKKPLKDPIPIQFFKVLPGVVFRFQFHLVAYENEEFKLSIEAIKKLFKSVLLDIGIGAKTNVGYGQFITPRKKPTPEERNASYRVGRDKVGSSRAHGEQSNQTTEPTKFSRYPKEGEIIDIFGKIRSPSKEGKPNRITFLTEKKDVLQGFKHESFNKYEPGTYVKVKIQIDSLRRNKVSVLLADAPFKS